MFLFDRQGRLLLQRRALGKYHSPGVWSNTCCGHPYPDEPPFVAAARRTAEELGVAPALLCEAGTVRYDLPDEASGLIEREWNHLFVGLVTADVVPDPDEVDDFAFVSAQELRELQDERPFSVWFRTVFEAALPGIREIMRPGLVGPPATARPPGGWAARPRPLCRPPPSAPRRRPRPPAG